MAQRTQLVLLVVVWALAFAGSFLHYQLAAPTGDGFTRGFNRIAIFLGWQAISFLLAIITMLVARREEEEMTTVLSVIGHVPMVVSGVLLIAFVALVAHLALFA